jgi:DEAD/DEAH box helicase domain-containing protein
VQVNTQVVGFKKIKFHTMENVGDGKLTLPEQEMHTTAFWLTLPRDLMESLPYGSTERLDGVNGLANALVAIATLLVMCDARDLGVAVGENEENRIQDSGFRIQDKEQDPSSLAAVGDQSEIQNLKSKIASPESKIQNPKSKIFEPNIYLYDKYPGGVGLSEPLFRMSDSLLEKTQRLIANCPCASGCPSCVGPMGEVGEKGKEVALEILRRLSVVRGP